MKKFLLTIFSLLVSVSVFAQAGGMKGVVVARDDRQPISGVAISVNDVALNTTTNQNGEFLISHKKNFIASFCRVKKNQKKH